MYLYIYIHIHIHMYIHMYRISSNKRLPLISASSLVIDAPLNEALIRIVTILN